MHSRKAVPIIDLMNAANMELIRLDFKSSTLSRHSKEFRNFSNFAEKTRSPPTTQKQDHNISNTVMVWTSVTPPQN